MILIAMLVCMASCKTQFALQYNVQVTGDADGAVNVQFPQGYFCMFGNAELKLAAGDTLPLNTVVTSKQAVLQKNNKDEVDALREVNNALANQFTASAATGTYDLLIQGTVTETATGLTFNVNKRLTNRENVKAPARDETVDAYPFVQ